MNDLSFLHEIRGQRILVAPLNWGLGHAARCIPIIRALSQHNEILIGSDGESLDLLTQEFPKMSYVRLPPYNIHYREKNFLWGMIKQSPKMIGAISQEMALTSDIVDRFKLNMIISDHRLGCRDKRIKSIIVAHQLQIQANMKIASIVGSKPNKYFINAFDECWIPDYESKQSRLTRADKQSKYDISVVLSGPEPQRSNIERRLYDKLKDTPNRSKLIIARTGYTTIMDMAKLNKRCILIPTPGQTEQEYLMHSLNGRNNFNFIKEEELDRLLEMISSVLTD